MTAESIHSGPNYIAIIGDLRHSRRIRSRAELQDRLLDAILQLNGVLSEPGTGDTLAAPISMTAGDEVQALLNAGHFQLSILNQLSDAADPAQFTFGVGFGTISTRLNNNVALVDGPAFHNARESIDIARLTGAWASALGFDQDNDAIAGMLGLLGAVRARWTDRQRYFIEQVEQEKTQSRIAEDEGISPSVVSESLRAAAYNQFVLGADGLSALINRHSQLEPI